MHHSSKNKWARYKTMLGVGFFLAIREIKRANIWTTGLIIAVMVLTFLNLIVVSGILVGLIDGSIVAYKDKYLADVFISTPTQKTYIEKSQDIVKFAESLSDVDVVTARYTKGARVEANYRTRERPTDLIDSASGIAAGINPEVEDAVTNLSKYVIEGEYLEPEDYDQILIGANMLYKYTPIDSPDQRTLKNVEVGSKVRLVIGEISREVTIKGVLKTKVGEIDQRIFMVDTQFRNLVNRYDYNVGEIAIRLKPDSVMTSEQVRDAIIETGADKYARVLTAEESVPKFVQDIQSTFAILGNLIGSIGLAVASITIFIVIFVNAITRRRYIGILKGIGISSGAIEFSYVIQSFFYAVCGMLIGLVFVYGIIKPYFDMNPIDFPFSDGILVATVSGTIIRIFILTIATMIAGYIPARIVVKQNTLNAILGR